MHMLWIYDPIGYSAEYQRILDRLAMPEHLEPQKKNKENKK